jgi:ParB family chromosome partitioning protein
MRMPWNKSKAIQLDLLEAAVVVDDPSLQPTTIGTAVSTAGQPLMVAATSLYEDANNPRTEFPDAELEELAEDIRQHGILQPIVVHPADSAGRHRIHFGAKRWRAAQRAGLQEVPVVVRNAPADPYTQVAENQKRHGLTPLDLARFIRRRVDAGDSNATVAKRLGMNLTTVAHHLALLDLPPELDQALQSGRCTSPRTLHELSKLHAEQPGRVKAMVASNAEITRNTVTAMRARPTQATAAVPKSSKPTSLIAQANSACDQLEQTLAQIKPPKHKAASADLIALRQRIADLAARWLPGV